MTVEQEHAAMKAAIEWFLSETERSSKRNAVTWPEPDGFGEREIRLERSLVEGIFRDALRGIPLQLNRNTVERIGLEGVAEA